VILEFPAGPPKLPISVVWDGTPLTLSRSERVNRARKIAS
jgi:hypothetical protein